jgi:hypothetical protein
LEPLINQETIELALFWPEDRHFEQLLEWSGANMTLPTLRSGLKSAHREWVKQGRFRMPDSIARANIEHFKKLLETEADPQERRMIERELAEEELKLAAALKRQSERKEG